MKESSLFLGEHELMTTMEASLFTIENIVTQSDEKPIRSVVENLVVDLASKGIKNTFP